MPHRYAANFCEENVWHLAAAPELLPGLRRVIIVASHGDVVPLWQQRAAGTPEDVVFWDYHVLLAVSGSARWIYDLDTRLPFPCPLDRYLAETFGPGVGAPAELQPWFRVIDASAYRQRFTSDRSHMRGPDGVWLSPPPPWPPLSGEAPALPLAAAIDMRDATALGEVCDLVGLPARLAG